MMRRKHENHEDYGADAAGSTGIILLLTCIPGYQMLQMQHAIWTVVCRSSEINGYLLRRQQRYNMLQDQEASFRSVHASLFFATNQN